MLKLNFSTSLKNKAAAAIMISRGINRQIEESIQRSPENGKRITIPSARKFSDIFCSVEPRGFGESAADLKVFQSSENKSTMSIKDTLYCGHHPFRVTVKEGLLDGLNPIFVQWDSLYWELTQRMNGTTLVSLKHNQIIGSRWIAIIRTDSLPECLRNQMMDED